MNFRDLKKKLEKTQANKELLEKLKDFEENQLNDEKHIILLKD